MPKKKTRYTAAQKKAMKHSNEPGAGAEARKKLNGQEKVGLVMHEFKHHTLHSGSGKIVTDPQQAKAIAMSEAGLSNKGKPKKKAQKKRIQKKTPKKKK